MSFVSSTRNSMLCSNINFSMDNNNLFVDNNDLDTLIKHRWGIIKGKSLGEINVAQIENSINNNPYIQDVKAYTTIDGELSIYVHQRVPLIRVFNPLNQSFYIDETGNFIPLSEKSSARVLVVSGFIYDSYKNRAAKIIDIKDTNKMNKSMIDTIYTLAQFIHNDRFLNSLIQQIYVNLDRELELIPNLGKQTIIIGDISDLDLKFKELLRLYKKGFSKYGWNSYSYINLKYKYQIVCTKIK
jgi:cell division protein FtsQ